MKKQKLLNGHKHLAVVGIIFNKKGRILLTQRDEPKSTHSHLHWQFPGGGMEFGEHPIDTLYREVKEETGIEIDVLSESPILHSHVFKPENIHALVIGFPALYKAGKIDISQDKNTGDAGWFTLKEVKKLLHLPEIIEMTKQAEKFLKL